MGNSNSGRRGGKPVIEQGLVLDLTRLMRQGLVKPHTWRQGTLRWYLVSTGEPTSSIGYDAHLLNERNAWMRLHYTITRWNGEKVASDYRVRLETTPLNFGGQRWWFVCPRTGRRAAKLYLPNGATQFASRYAYRMAYRSQNADAMDRALPAIDRAFKALGGDWKHPDDPPPRKPKWMRWKTYARVCAQLEVAQDLREEAFIDGSTRILRRLATLDSKRRRPNP